MQGRAQRWIGLSAGLVIMLGIYLLFSAPSHPNLRSAETNAPEQSGQRSSDEGAPPEPKYDLASLPSIEASKQVEFGAGKDNRALISGWSVPEPGGIWSVGKDAAIGFVVRCELAPCATDDALLHFDGLVYLAPGHFRQSIELWIGPKKVDKAAFSLSPVMFAMELKGVALQDGTPLVLSLHLPDAVVQGKFTNSNDPRELAFRIASLRLEP